MRHGAQPEIVRALGHQQAHAAIAGQLQRELPCELQRGGEQHGGRGGLAKQ